MKEDIDVDKAIRLAVCSDQRKEILLLICRDGVKSLRELRDELKLSSPAIIHALRELESIHFIRQDPMRNYVLTPIGKSAGRNVIDFQAAMAVLMKYEAFWLEHDLGGIPDHLFDRIGSLRDAALIAGTPTDIFKALRHFVELLRDSKVVKLISPFYIQDIGELVLEQFARQQHVALVLTDEVSHHLIDEIGRARLSKARSENLTLYVTRDNPKLVLVVADPFVALALYRSDGSFDYSYTLTSQNREAIAWGQELFDYYVASSESVVL
ncbi:MAG: transcriptional regulator FilR1 domain-containing protein [Halobacteriota archaeon]|jgi:predicted transcriptional regulator